MDITRPVQVKEGLWWVGDALKPYRLQCNPFLLLEGGSAVLFDPGSVLDVDIVMENVRRIIPIDKIDAIVLSHQDPDLCSALPTFERNGFKGVLCCHERAAMIVKFYGLKSEFYLVNTNNYRYQLKDDSYLNFIFAPYLHFPGAIMTYLTKQKALISGDLFGAFSDNWKLFAEGDYDEAMKTFHEAYMPSHENLEPVMRQLLNYDIEVICPQHGSIINSDVRRYITILKDLPCGNLMQPVHDNLFEAGGYLALCTEVLKRYFALYGSKEVRQVFAKSEFTIDYQEKVIKKTTLANEQLWDAFFIQVVQIKGMPWITVISPLVERLCQQYTIHLPMVFESIIFNAQQSQDQVNLRIEEVEGMKRQLEISLKNMEERVVRCPITNLYNQGFFDYFITQEMKKYSKQSIPFSVMLLSIDNLSDINLDFGSSEGDNTMKNLAYVLRQSSKENLEQNFRLEGGIFSVYLSTVSKTDAIDQANRLRTTVAESELFIVPVTISLGLFHSDEIPQDRILGDEEIKQIAIQTARFRLKLAKKLGKNGIVSDSDQQSAAKAAYTVLLVDEPGIQRDIIQKSLEQQRYHVIVASNGLQARYLVDQENPDIIVSELMVPKLSAFTLRKELLNTPRRRKTPFILMSANKNENTIGRAIGLGITYFFPRPVILVELLGVIGLITTRLELAEV